MSFKRDISEDISIEIDDEGMITIYSSSLGESIALSSDELEEIEFAYEDWTMQPIEDS